MNPMAKKKDIEITERLSKRTYNSLAPGIEPKSNVGRPKVKTEDTKNINIAVPISILSQVAIAKCKYNNNMTEYINAIIKADLEKNMEKYKELNDLLNS